MEAVRKCLSLHRRLRRLRREFILVQGELDEACERLDERRADEYSRRADMDDFDDYPEDDYFDDDFADPGGRSALRAATPDNPRDQPCPTCGAEDVLTRKDVALGYQCDGCADRAEGGGF